MTYSDLSWDLSAPSNDRGGKGMGIRLKHGGGAQVEELTTSWLSSEGPNLARVELARYWRRGGDRPPPPPPLFNFCPRAPTPFWYSSFPVTASAANPHTQKYS